MGKDSSKFGQRMLEKMGWTKGRGLGAKEHGQTEHIKVTLKTDKKGVGCSRNFADKWIEHQDEFNTLLASLNQDHSQGNKACDDNMDSSITQVSSLEAKSKLSRSRVHYQKFTKGKDLSSKSLHDLACVFGHRKSKSEASSDAEDNEKNSQGNFTVKSEDSVQEYFAKKMAALQRSKYEKDNTCSPKSDDIDDKSDDKRETDQLLDKLKKKSKSQKKSVTFSIGDEEINTEEETRIKENAVTVNISNEETNLFTKSRSIKSKKRKYLEKMENQEGNVKVASLSIECNSVSEPKTSKRKDEFHQEGSSNDELVNKSDNSLKRGHETSLKFEEDNLNSDSANKYSNHFSAVSRQKKSKKRKHSKKSAGSLQEEANIDEDLLCSAEAEPVLELMKSKKKRYKSENIEMGMKEESKVDTMEGNKEGKEKEKIKSKSSKKSKKKKETYVEHKEVKNVTVDVIDNIEGEKEDSKKRSLIEECKDDRNEKAVNDNKQNDDGSSNKSEKMAAVHLPTGISPKSLNFPYVYEVKKAFTGSNVDRILGYVDYQFRHKSMSAIRKKK